MTTIRKYSILIQITPEDSIHSLAKCMWDSRTKKCAKKKKK